MQWLTCAYGPQTMVEKADGDQVTIKSIKVNRPVFELTPRSWTNFKGFHEEVSNRVQARGSQEFFGR